MAQYGKTAYWDERYTKDPEPFDWYQRYSGIRDLIAQYVKKEDNILVAGCGNSRLSEDMYEDGYSSIANIDISRVVIDQMIEKYKEKPALTWQQMNVCSLEYPDESYDAVIAKATMVRATPSCCSYPRSTGIHCQAIHDSGKSSRPPQLFSLPPTHTPAAQLSFAPGRALSVTPPPPDRPLTAAT